MAIRKRNTYLCLVVLVGGLSLVFLFLETRQLSLDKNTGSTEFRRQGSRHSLETSEESEPENYLGAIQGSRRHGQRQACSSLGFYDDAIYGDGEVLSRSYLRNMHLSLKHQTMICLIPKVGSSNWMGTLLILEGILNSTEGMGTQAINKLGKKHIKSLSSFSRQERQAILKNFTTVLFVRNPFTRLLSAFRDRLETYPNRNIFHRKRHNKKIFLQFGNHPAEEIPDESVKSEKYNVTFREFVDYYLNGTTDVHWREQYKVCPPCIDYDYLGNIETFENDYNQILTMIGAGENVPRVRTSHTTHSSADKILRQYYGTLSSEQMRKLTDILGVDMKLFQYDVPEVLRKGER
ncbi:carbohydrate sulfotransferase 9-like [Diadema antillarum]|uniref:carbohydrate sulfotransferase 9-like n=1 Tax=Diadema antillarum TaxID=105358 RepID=UPI003A843886